MPVKRSKSTSSNVGVSPDTMRLRPKSKLPRKRLYFEVSIELLDNCQIKFKHSCRLAPG